MPLDVPSSVEPLQFVKEKPTQGFLVMVRICSRWLSWNGAKLDGPFEHPTLELANRAAEEARKYYVSLEKSLVSRGAYEEIRIVQLL